MILPVLVSLFAAAGILLLYNRYRSSGPEWLDIVDISDLPWRSDQAIRIIATYNTHKIQFEYDSPPQAVRRLGSEHITREDPIPTKSATCHLCRDQMNPFTGTEGYEIKYVYMLFPTRQAVSICNSCSSEVRRGVIEHGTHSHSTAELFLEAQPP